MDAAQKERVEALMIVIRRAVDQAIAKDAVRAEATDVMLAFVAHAVSVSKMLEIDNDEFFDMVVNIYEWTSGAGEREALMTDDEKRQSQLALIWRVLDRPDLNRGQRVVFLDMRVALSEKGVVLSDAQERWLTSVLERPAPDPEKSQAVQVPRAWQPMRPEMIMIWVGGAVLALIVAQFCLTFLMHWLGWRVAPCWR